MNLKSEPSLRARIRAAGRETVASEARAVAALEARLDATFEDAVLRVLGCCTDQAGGHLVLCGMGKPYFIAQKLSATFASTGISSFALHPADALHGDLGRLRSGDVVILLSNSGATAEIVALLAPLRRTGVSIVAITSKPDSPLGQEADIVLDLGPITEACPLGLAPTTSSTAMLALGDALAMACLAVRDFDRAAFARFHPAGSLGRRLMRVEELMRDGAHLPRINAGASVRDAVRTMSDTPRRPGAVCVVHPEDRAVLAGIVTDGDVRRLIASPAVAALLAGPVDAVMTPQPTVVRATDLVEAAAHVMAERGLDQVPVLDAGDRLVGLLDVQDLLAIGYDAPGIS